MTRVRVADTAKRDIDQIWDYLVIRSQSIEIADRSVDSITGCFDLLARSPAAGARRNDIDAGLRGFPTGSYIISYHKHDEYVVISRVIHGMRDQKAAYKDEQW